MWKLMLLFFMGPAKKLLLLVFIGIACAAIALGDAVEDNFPLRRVEGPRFIIDLSYLRADNFLKHPFYRKFGIRHCYVHEDLMPNMKRLEAELAKRNLKAILFDCFRPHEAQLYMWDRYPDARYVADPRKRGSLHSKGLALDIALADDKGRKLEFTTLVDHFKNESHSDYKCRPGEERMCENRAMLKSVMESAGFRGIRNEWWHYQLVGGEKEGLYPLIRVCGKIRCDEGV
jgi:D-alanyl-D-alanine dipeptidase